MQCSKGLAAMETVVTQVLAGDAWSVYSSEFKFSMWPSSNQHKVPILSGACRRAK